MKNLSIEFETPTKALLSEYAKLSIEYLVESEFHMEWINNGLGGIGLTEVQVEPYWKNYDTPDNNPSHLIDKFDMANWKVLSVYDGAIRVAGAILAFETQGIHMLEGRNDLVDIWDIRVDKAYRGHGVGQMLFAACVDWAREMKCTRIKVETQNNNTKACKFYASQGAKLSNVNKHAYKDPPVSVWWC